MHQATRAIIDAFNEKDIKYAVEENDKFSYVKAGFHSETGTPVTVMFISSDEDNDVAVFTDSLVKLPEAKLPELFRVVNELNRDCRYLKFVVNKDNDLRVEFDLPIRTDNVGPVAVEIFIRVMKTVDEKLPIMMKAIWA